MAPQAVLAAAIDAQQGALLAGARRDGKLRPKVVHDLRVALRRLLTALELATVIGCDVEPGLTRSLRRLLGRLSPARDAHVQLKTLLALSATHPGAQLVIDELEPRRRAAARRAKKRLKRLQRRKFERRMAALLETLKQSEPSSSAAARNALFGELARRHLSLERRRDLPVGDPRALHQIRLRLKDYRYALDALGPLLPEPAQGLTRLCAQLQDALGKAHDAHVLAETSAELAKRQRGSQAAELEDLTRELERSAITAHRQALENLAQADFSWPSME